MKNIRYSQVTKTFIQSECMTDLVLMVNVLLSKLTCIGNIRYHGRDIFFPLFIRKEIKTRTAEKKLKQHNISFKRLIMSLVQENQKGN